MIRRHPRSTRTDTLFPYTTLFRSPRNTQVAAKYAKDFPKLQMFTIDRNFGGWARAQAAHFNDGGLRSEEHTSELQSLMRISYAVFCLKKKNNNQYVLHLNKEKTHKNSYILSNNLIHHHQNTT